MLRGLWRLTWIEIKIFAREPLGVIGTVGIPVVLFVGLGRVLGPAVRSASPDMPRYVSVDLPIFASLLIAASAVLSLVAIIAIYRDPQTAEGDASATLHDSDRARDSQAAVHRDHACGHGAGRPAVLPR